MTSHGARLRTIITRPNACSKAVTHASQSTRRWDIPRPSHGSPAISLSMATSRCASSTPAAATAKADLCRDVRLGSRVDGYKSALQALEQFDFVDADSVFLVGHSMGGMFAPLIAVELAVKGIAVYGSGAGTWFEAVFEQRRRLASLDGTKPNEIDREILDQARFWSALLIGRKMPREILGAHPELQEVDGSWRTST